LRGNCLTLLFLWYIFDMNWQSVTWPIPLDTQPVALYMGLGRHGGVPVERYTLGDVWCLHLYRYNGWMRVRGGEFPIRPGHVSLTPPHVELEHQFDAAVCVHISIHFALPADLHPSYAIPAMQDTGADFARLNTALEEAVGIFPFSPRRAEVRLWDTLWHLTGRTQPTDPMALLHPAVRQTLQAIELRLSEPLSMAALAAEADLSHSHLSRLFRAEVGSTIIGYLQRRRVERARHLLVYSSLPPRAIAAQVGIPDLHLFNKTLRRALGRSPRALREDAQNKVQ
jgi:AraC-like DNA-binding protein